MSVFRLAIDEASGRVSGPPQPLGVPLPFACHLSFTRDGRKPAAGERQPNRLDRATRLRSRRGCERAAPASTVFESSLRLFYVGVPRRPADRHLLGRPARGPLHAAARRHGSAPAHERRLQGPRAPPSSRTASGCSSTPTARASTRRGACASTAAALVQLTRTVGERSRPIRELSPDGIAARRGPRPWRSGLARLGATLPVAPEPLPDPGEGAVFGSPEWSTRRAAARGHAQARRPAV